MDSGTTKVLILTGSHRIEGEISLGPGARVTDYLVNSKPFLGITDAEVKDLDGNLRFRSSFLNVARDRIHILTPLDIIR